MRRACGHDSRRTDARREDRCRRVLQRLRGVHSSGRDGDRLRHGLDVHRPHARCAGVGRPARRPTGVGRNHAPLPRGMACGARHSRRHAGCRVQDLPAGDAVKPRSVNPNLRAFRSDWNHGRERTTVYARATAAAVVLLRGRGPGCVLQSFDTIDAAERYAYLFGGRVAKPTAGRGGGDS